MSRLDSQALSIHVDDQRHVSGLLQMPPGARAACILAHGAGAGMTHSFLAEIASGLAERGIATLRYQFPYMEQGVKRPDTPKIAQFTVRAAAAVASSVAPDLPLFAAGKSFGGRMTSQAQAEGPLPGVRGLIFLGFPLHPAGRPSVQRAQHLFQVLVPMLFLQGTRDTLADLQLLKGVAQKLGNRATLEVFEGADHSFHIPARTGRTDAAVQGELLDKLAAWIEGVLAADRVEPAKHPHRQG